MTHRWGFDLSSSAVRLMRREAGHWREIAAVALDGDDMDQKLRALVEQVPDPRVVDIFLPRDQILYTDVKLENVEKAVPEIEAAMDGRTPYALSELEIDWEIGADETARVAAIARVTLSEAEAFVDQFGLGVARFSSIPDPDDFPRQPDFGIGAAGSSPGDDTDDAEPEEEDGAEFATTRSETPPEPQPKPTLQDPDDDATHADESTPVVRVDDAEPVMQVAKERSAPLDPGPALPRPQGAPRVRADLSLPDGGGRAAASLTPPEPIDPYGKSEARPTARLRVIGIGLAAILTAGIALVVWSILPETPEETGLSAELPGEQALAATPALSDIPPVTGQVDFATLAAPDFIEEANVSFQSDALIPASRDATRLADVAAEPGDRPDPLLPPDRLGAAWTEAPAVLASLAPFPDESGIAFDAPIPPVTRPGNVGLPGVQGFAAGTAPPPDEAPAYVIPPPPTVAVAPPAVAEDQPEDAPAEIAEVTPEPEPETDTSGVDDEIATLAEDPSTPPAPAEAEGLETASPEPDAPAETVDVVATALPEPTELAAALTDTRSRPRPSDFELDIQRQTFGGRTEDELAVIRPPGRPASAQVVAEAERGNSQPSTLVIAASPDPRGRPDNIDAIIASTLAAQRAQRLAALPTANTTDAVRAALGETEEEAATNPRNSPRLAIPSNADVARQATIEDAIRLNRLNLVGVFGAPSDRRALIRMPSGRYVKVKIGDSVDGGTIAAISEDALQYRKGGRVFQLNMPKG